MIPAAFVCLRELPLTANGKLDRSALPEPVASDSHGAGDIEPRDEQEVVLCRLWSQVLGVPRVNADSDFFRLGGHSLSAVRLVALVRSTLDVDVSLRDVFDRRSVRAFAALLAERSRASVPSPPATVELGSTGPLSFAQERLWFIDQLAGGSAHYAMFGGFQLTGRLDRRALRRALTALLARHESLRTVFASVNGSLEDGVCQRVLEDWDAALLERDLSSLDADEADRQIEQIVREEPARRFDLARELPARFTLITCADDRWILLANVHHVACDGWSVGILFDDLSRAYAAYAEQREPELAASALRYVAFAHRQREGQKAGRFDADLTYWKAKLADVPPVHSLPLRAPRPQTPSHAGRSHEQALPAALTASLNALCRARGVTLFMALETAFAVLLGRYGNVTDVVIGTAVSGRDELGSDRTVGLFVNTVAVRTDLAENPSFDALLASNQATILDAYEHQSIPFDVLVEGLRPARSLGYDPIVQIALTLQNQDTPPLALTGLSVKVLRPEQTLVKFELQLDVEPVGDRLELRWLYKTELFDDAFIRRMSANFETLLGGIVANPQGRILELPLLDRGERALLLREISDARLLDAPAGCLHEYFEANARRRPDGIAVRSGARHITYDELNRQSNRLARYLGARGVGPESLVGLCVEPSIDTLVGILGILKAGGAYVPIGPELPELRVRYLLRDAAIDVVVTQASLRAKLQLDDRVVVCLGSPEYEAASSVMSDENLDRTSPAPAGQDAAYVIYTSGSTGEPKGVVVEHRNVLSLLQATGEHFRFTHDDVWTLFHSFAFDFSVWEIWGALMHGGCVVVVPAEVTKDPDRLSLLLTSERVTVLNQTPQAFYGLQEAMIRTGCRHQLRYVVFGGEALDYSKLRPWYDRYGQRTALVNMYGITETTVHVTFAAITTHDVEAASSSIGRPLSNLVGLVCNERQELQPIGAAGELLVAGGGVARGYLNRPELTRQRFVSPAPYGAMRFYRTGDLVRRSEAGTLAYLGRIDGQIKIRGFRIEPGEIEKQLSTLAVVKACVVVARASSAHGNTLVAYVVPRRDATNPDAQNDDTAHACRAHLHARLPSHMVPSTFIVLSELPTTSNGKVDYRALPAPDERTPHAGDAPPRDELESKLVAAWKEVLGLEALSIDDNFFEVGGQSLATITLTTLLRRKYRIDLPVAELFRHQTIRSLSGAIRSGTLERESIALLLNVRGAKPPLFFLPPATGVGHCFMGLSAALPQDRPHYAFMTPGQETGEPLPASIESLAARYLDYIERNHGVVPHWYLAGYSVGGVVAYEIGRQCLAKGYPPPHLLMLDSYLPWHKPLIPLRPAQILYDVYGADASRYLTTAKHLVKLFFEYKPRPAPLGVTLFKAMGSSSLIYSNRRKWQRYAVGGFEVIPIPGGHRTLLDPKNVPALARALEGCLAAKDQSSR